MSGSDGAYRIANAPVGSRVLFARLIGRRPDSASVSVAEGQATTQDFTLVSDPLARPVLPFTFTAGVRYDF